MGLLEPTGLLAGLFALPIIALWVLRPRRRPRVVGSTLLWQQALANVQASRPWQRLRWHALLALQLAAIALLALALGRPYRTTPGQPVGQTFVLLDASASMQATDIKPSRFVAAKRLVAQAIEQLPSGVPVTIVAMASQPRLLMAGSTDHSALEQTLAAARPTNGEANLRAALGLIAPLAAGRADSRVLVFSDGGTNDATPLGTLPFPVDWVRVGTPADNLAIAAFAVSADEQGPVALARITNDGQRAASGEIQLRTDGRLYDARRFALEAGASVLESWTALPTGVQRLEARLSVPDDLASDNRAFALVAATRPARVLLVTTGNPFLEQALRLQPGVVLAVARAASNDTRADVVVYDSVAPGVLPPANVLLVHPPVGSLPWPVGADRPGGSLRTLGSSDLTRFLDLGQVHVRQTRLMSPPGDAQTVISDARGPALTIRQTGRQRIAVLGFDLHQSDLPLQPSFPVLMSNLIDWLRPGTSAADRSVVPDAVVSVVPWPAATRIRVVRPDGSSETLAPPFPVRPISDTDELGFYRVVQSAPGRADRVSWFAVNLFSSRESNLVPPNRLPVNGRINRSAAASSAAPADLWPWATAVILPLLLCEWWVYRRIS